MAQYSGYNQDGYNQQAGNPYAQGGNPYSQQQSNPYAQQQQQQPSNPYAQQQRTGYGQQNPYAQQGTNPYAQQGAQNGGYGGDIEMGQVNGQGAQRGGERAILDEIKDIDKAIEHLNSTTIPQIQTLQKQLLADTDSSLENPRRLQLDQLGAEVLATFENFKNRVNRIKNRPGAGSDLNASQVRRIQGRVGSELNKYQGILRDYEKQIKAQVGRNLRNMNQNATDEEIQEVVDSGRHDVYAQQLMQSNRSGQARTALSNVQDRSAALKKIERDMITLARLYEELNAMIVQHEEKITEIERKSKKVQDDQEGTNRELTGAVVKARAARNKKWICLGIVVLIIIIVIGAVAGYICTQPGKCGK